MSESNKDVLRGAIENVWNKGDLSAIAQYYAADVVIHGALPGLPPGLEGVRQVISAYRAAFPDVQLTIEELIAEGDTVADRWMWTGTHKGEFMGIAPTGKKVKLGGVSIVRIADGKIVEIRSASDNLELMKQLGAIAA